MDVGGLPIGPSYGRDPCFPEGSQRKKALDQLEDPASARPKIDGPYSCPYRKHNPWMFNVRDHPICATHTFRDIPLLKRHIMTSHRCRDFTLSCNRCGSPFRRSDDLEAHQESGICFEDRAQNANADDLGITESVETKLRDRRARHAVLDWKTLCETIFPGSDRIPSHEFVPVVEAHETWRYFFQRLGEVSRMESVVQQAKGSLQRCMSQGYNLLSSLGHTIRFIGRAVLETAGGSASSLDKSLALSFSITTNRPSN
ncbi:hypothetical protein NM208_g2512 [Fusarium decemcellulare]|uniref:Uncharacterized protein n=1 Tax=Fusarium decemcellulare TaxID=57161 RepID=A0ACC1SSH1_9HYPO|nr:hypothetical protein NM208_g2512 [Fusarium decemcellulare]